MSNRVARGQMVVVGGENAVGGKKNKKKDLTISDNFCILVRSKKRKKARNSGK